MASRKKQKKPVRSKWGKAALSGCDWFVNSQVRQVRPNWDANHGRFMYNVHVPSGFTTMGLGWTQARGIMCLLSAYKRTNDKKYLESAELGVNYAKILQNMDARFPLTFGAFHEETPHSPFSFPRDAIEVADAFLEWYTVTGDKDALYRAELFLKWFKRNAVKTYPGFGYWVKGTVPFDKAKKDSRFKKPISCEMGCITILAHAYYITKKPEYKNTALRIADSVLRNYLPKGSGPLLESGSEGLSHHAGIDRIIYNDDGGGVGLLNAYKLSGKDKYLKAAVQVADYYNTLDKEIPIYSGIGSVANFLIETDHVTGGSVYRKKAEELAKELYRLQVRSGNKKVRGGFRGEDEGGKWYVKESKNNEFVTTRVTCYSVLALFKLEGKVWPRGYSV
ncbi:hypothetical protein ACFL6F_02265 [Planctomycetota bacterium]